MSMKQSLILALLCVVSCAKGMKTGTPKSDHHQASALELATPSKTVAAHAFAAMARRFVHTDLLATGSNLRLRQDQGLSAESTNRAMATFAVLCVVVLVVIVLCVLVYSGSESEGDPAASKLLSGADATGVSTGSSRQPVTVVDPRMMSSPGLGVESPIPSHRRAHWAPQLSSKPPAGDVTAQTPAMVDRSPRPDPFLTMASPGAQRRSPRSQGMLQASPMPIQLGSPETPPQLCRAQAPLQAKAVLKVPKAALPAELLAQKTVEVLGAFNYPVAYVRLGVGPEGRRLELVTEPSWRDPEVIVGPLDRGYLADDASIYGPDRELYGPFQRTGTGFAVGHYMYAGSVLVLTPRQRADGICVDVNSGKGQSVAKVTSQGESYQIEIAPGVDSNLVIASILATVVASPAILDKMYTSI